MLSQIKYAHACARAKSTDHTDSIKIKRTPCLSNTTMINKEINKSAVRVAVHAPQRKETTRYKFKVVEILLSELRDQ